MGIFKPFYRIARPKVFMIEYVRDERYASDRVQLSRAYINIEKELRNLFQYIEPDERNKNTFSFELYSLLLRACTEVELNCKKIMETNGAVPNPQIGYFTMSDYKKLEKSSLLSKYTATFRNWRQRNSITKKLEYVRKEFCPFKNFDSSINKSPDWYVAYNNVKHNREENMEKANLENCMNAVAGILILLYSQFGASCIEAYGNPLVCMKSEDAYDIDFDADVIFEICPPKISDWPSSELYEFDWEDIKDSEEPYDKFLF